MISEEENPQNASPQLTETEQKIFDAAHEVFLQRGLDGAKMQEIADRAGINKALLHYYYRTKEKLYETVAKAILTRNVPMIRRIIESELPLQEKIEKFVDQYITVISQNHYLPIFLISEMNKHPDRFFETVIPKNFPKPQKFIEQVEEEVEKGTIRPIDARHLVVNLMSMCLFPFVAKPMLRMVLGISPGEWILFIEDRKRQVKEFIFASLRP